jgi:hypothetical protein
MMLEIPAGVFVNAVDTARADSKTGCLDGLVTELLESVAVSADVADTANIY